MEHELFGGPSTVRRDLRVIVVALIVSAANASAQASARHHAHAFSSSDDTAYAGMQSRGAQVMGVDQYSSTHHFIDLPDGGRIELQRDPGDSAGVAMIRQHLHHIARAFKGGDFGDPMLVHMQQVPGTATMAAKRDVITYSVADIAGGGAVRIATRDSAALNAVHMFLAFQRHEHHAN